MKIAEFFATLGFDADTKGLDNFDNSLNDIKRNMIGVKELILGGLVYGINQLTNKSANAANALYDFNTQTGLSIERLQKWQSAGVLSNIGLTADEVTASVQALNNQLVNISLGRGDITPFELLGIDPRGLDAFDVLDRLRDVIPQMDRNYASNILSQLGINAKMMNSLLLSNEQFYNLSNKFLRSEDIYKANIKAGLAVNALSEKLSYLRDVFVADLEPAIRSFISWFDRFYTTVSDVVDENKEAIKYTALFAAGLWALTNPIKAATLALVVFFDDIVEFFRDNKALFEPFMAMIDMGFIKPLEKAYDLLQKIKQWWNGSDEESKGINFITQGQANAPKWLQWLMGWSDGIVRSGFDANMNNPDSYLARAMGAAGVANNFTPTFNNNYYINSNANPDEIASQVAEKTQEQVQQTYDFNTTDFNNNGY